MKEWAADAALPHRRLMTTRIHVILNARAGTADGLTPDALDALLQENGFDAVVDARADRPLDDRIAEALASDASVIAAAGGDGTVTAVASALIGTDRALAILPLGTANMLARDLAIPIDVPAIVAALPTYRPIAIDVGFVNGAIFLHKVVIGLIPGLAAGRERVRGSSLAAKLGFLRYFVRRLRRARRMAVEIVTDRGRRRVHRVKAVAVASNAYDEGFGMFFSRRRLDRGHLTLYTLRDLTVGQVLRLAGGMIIGRWRAHQALTITPVSEVTIRSRRARLMAMIDGEVRGLATPLRFTLKPRALTVLAPPMPPAGGEA